LFSFTLSIVFLQSPFTASDVKASKKTQLSVITDNVIIWLLGSNWLTYKLQVIP
jgi:hypothetical protein